MHKVPAFIGASSGLLFVISLACCIFALRIRSYEGIADLERVIEEFPSDGISDQVFFDHRIADLAVATNRNSEQNDEAARALGIAGWLLFGGVLLQAIMLVIALAR